MCRSPPCARADAVSHTRTNTASRNNPRRRIRQSPPVQNCAGVSLALTDPALFSCASGPLPDNKGKRARLKAYADAFLKSAFRVCSFPARPFLAGAETASADLVHWKGASHFTTRPHRPTSAAWQNSARRAECFSLSTFPGCAGPHAWPSCSRDSEPLASPAG